MPARVLLLLILAACGADRPFLYLAPRGVPTDPAHGFARMPEPVRRAARQQPLSRRQLDAVPATLTASDGTGLALVRLRARGVVDGPLAFTELELTFRNPTDRTLEGRFSLAVPPGAAVSRFAMKTAGAWMEAEVVERRLGQDVYESHLHRGVDPALLEHDAGNRFAARVFPIAAGERKEILVSYSHELADPGEAYRIPLVGLPRLEVLEVSARVGDRLVRRSEQDVVPVRDFTVEAPRGRDALVAGDVVALRVAPALDAARDPLVDLAVLVDTSASVGRALPDRVDDVARLARQLGAARLAVIAFDQTVDLVYDGPADGFGAAQRDALLLRRALGASHIEAALRRAGRTGVRRLLLVSDGVATAGATDVAALAAAAGTVDRLDALTAADGDVQLLRQLAARAGARPGVVLRTDAGAADWQRRMSLAAAATIDVSVAGASWTWPERLEGLQPGDHAVVFARIERPGKSARVELGGRRTTIPLAHATAAPLLEREAAQAEIERLLARGGHDADAVALSLRHRVLTPLTALLVLESDADYGRFGLDRTALADLLTVDATGLRHLRRGGLRAAATVASTRPFEPVADGGAITGIVSDRNSNEPLAGVTVVATSPSVDNGSQAAITDADGRYLLPHLQPGTYAVTAYYSDVEVRRTDIVVHAEKTTPVFIKLDQTQSGSEVIEIKGTPSISSTISSTSTSTSVVDVRDVPVPGRSFASAAGATVDGVNTSSSEPLGVSFSGSVSLENRYFLDSRPPPEPPHGSRTPYTGRLLEVMRLLERGDLDAALVLALRWRRDAPWDLLALVALGEALEARGALSLAARAYGSIVDEAPSRAEMRRFAAGRLARLGAAAAALAVDVLERAVALRPDHPSGVRQLAYALLRAGRHRRAIEVLLDGITRPDDPRGRLSRARELLAADAGVIAADWLRRAPSERGRIERMLDGHQILVPLDPSVRFVVTWENDATDIDLHVAPAGARFSRATADAVTTGVDVADGWGPEQATIDGPGARDGYQLWVDYTTRAMMGTAFGQLDIVSHDGGGRVRVETRPFVVMVEGAEVDLGAWHR
ncbi:MAG TPA: VIT domain-containing protein [Kofleriaceae bacterium]|nr:VIT domain-containing protein [Kofleriaceae bacterium]